MTDERPQTENPGRFICARCRKRYARGGACAEHPKEPLLDTSDPLVQGYLAENDEKARRDKVGRKLMWVRMVPLSIGVLMLVLLGGSCIGGAEILGALPMRGAIASKVIAAVVFVLLWGLWKGFRLLEGWLANKVVDEGTDADRYYW